MRPDYFRFLLPVDSERGWIPGLEMYLCSFTATAPVQALLWLTTDVQPFTRTIARILQQTVLRHFEDPGLSPTVLIVGSPSVEDDTRPPLALVDGYIPIVRAGGDPVVRAMQAGGERIPVISDPAMQDLPDLLAAENGVTFARDVLVTRGYGRPATIAVSIGA